METEVIHRSEIKLAAYNPRKIDEAGKKRLKADLKSHGLVETLVWNKRTGILISGHQRLFCIDELEKRKDYDLVVSVVDVPEKEERELNIILNNPALAGEWDLDKLKDLAITSDIKLEDVGFTPVDIDFLFEGDSKFSQLFKDSQKEKAVEEEIKEMKKDRKEFVEKIKKANSPDFYFVVVCETQEEKAKFLNEFGVPAR